MSKVITFSRVFPSYHPRKGEPTNFVEQVLYGLIKEDSDLYNTELLKNKIVNIKALDPNKIKYTTIRAGNRWKKGDYFSPRVWGDDINPKSGKNGPYHSKQITIAPDIEIKRVFDVEFVNSIDSNITGYDYGFWCKVEDIVISDFWLKELAINDGLTLEDAIAWFNVKPNKIFKGQIICWSDKVDYTKNS